MKILLGAWAGLDNRGRIVLIVALCIVLVAFVAMGVDLGAVAAWLGGN